MRINKVICNQCKREINMETDDGIAFVETNKLQTKFDLAMITNKPVGNREVVTVKYDICRECLPALEQFLEFNEKKVEENKNSNTKK